MDSNKQNTIYQTLDKVCNHSLFYNSTSSVELLRFLVEKSLEGENVKEQVIGIELFNKSYASNQSDGKVRVYMYNLRKRLKEYYSTDGEDDPVVFNIHKGQYNLTFTWKEAPEELQAVSNRKKLYAIGGGAISLILLLLVYFNTLKRQTCWEAFFKNGATNACIVADHFVVYDRTPRQKGSFRGVNKYIRTKEEYSAYMLKYPNAGFTIADVTFLTKMAPFSIHELTKWFLNHGSDFSLQLESDNKFDHLQSTNFLYIGQTKTMSASKAVFLKDSKVFEVLRDGFSYKKDTISRNYIALHKQTENINKEYAMVSYHPLSKESKVLFFASNNDIGTMATIKQFTNSEWLDEFYSNLPEEAVYFNALFEIYGLKRTDLECKLEKLEIFDKDMNSLSIEM